MAFTDFNLRSNPSAFYIPIGILNISILLLANLFAFQTQGRLNPGAAIFLGMYILFHAIQFQARQQASTPLVREFIDSQYSDPRAMSFIFLFSGAVWYVFLSTVSGGSGVSLTFPTTPLLSSAGTAISNDAFVLALNVISAPFVEEAFFLGALPALLIMLLFRLGVVNRLVVLGLVLVTVSALFASFHLQTTEFTQFWFAAFFFSVVVRGTVLSDYLVNSVNGVAVFISAAIGAHIANNMLVTGGVLNYFSVVSSEPVLFWVSVVALLIYVVLAGQFLFEKVVLRFI